ncbi:hypothetical protein EV177_010874, partial [Coemansia sp. RSA 1804]
MQSIDLILEALKDDEVDVAQQYETGPPVTAFGARGILFDSGDEALSSGSSYTDMLATAKPLSSSSSVESGDELQTREGAADADDNDASEVGSGDEFYETSDRISEAQREGVSGPVSGKLRRKVNPEARTNIGKEPDRVLVKVNFAVDNLV